MHGTSREAAAESLYRRHERLAASTAARRVATAVEVLSNSGKQSYSRWEYQSASRVKVPMDLGNLQGVPLQGLTPRKMPGISDQSPGPDPNLSIGPDLNLRIDPEEVLEDIIQGHDLSPAPIVGSIADLTVEIIEDGIATVILPGERIGVMLGIGQILIPTIVLEYLG